MPNHKTRFAKELQLPAQYGMSRLIGIQALAYNPNPSTAVSQFFQFFPHEAVLVSGSDDGQFFLGLKDIRR